MKTVATVFLLATLGATGAQADLVAAELVADDTECSSSRMVFATAAGFSNTEWFGGLMIEGQVYFADFESFGFTDVYDRSGNEVGRVWVDDFWVSKSTASQFCYRG